MEEKRKVYFDDCEVGMFFRIDKDCPWMCEIGRMDGFDILRNADDLKVKIIDKDFDDDSVKIEAWADGQNTHITDWLYQIQDYPDETIGSNLEFIPKRKNRKNNYWWGGGVNG